MEATVPTTVRTAPHRGRRALMLGVLIAGIALGSATTSVVWASHTFPDVPTSSPFHADISWAAEHGIVNGKPDGLYHPNEALSRQAIAAIVHRYNNSFEIVNHAGSIVSSTEGTNTVTCPAGKRPLAGGGSTDAFNMFITDINIGSTSLSVRWETDNGATQSATTNAWALCAPAT